MLPLYFGHDSITGFLKQLNACKFSLMLMRVINWPGARASTSSYRFLYTYVL